MGRSGCQLRRSVWAGVDCRNACHALASLSVGGTRQDRSSRTAAGAALMRAAHQVLDDDPLILDDPVSIGLVEGSGREELLARAEELRSAELKVTRSWTLGVGDNVWSITEPVQAALGRKTCRHCQSRRRR